MTNGRRLRTRKSKIRSYRKPRQILLVCGVTLLVLGMVLTGVFLVKSNQRLVQVGMIYILLSALLLALRGILAYMDELSKQRRAANRLQRRPS